MFSRLKIQIVPLFVALSVIGCGRAGTPFTPEMVAPKRVDNLVVTADSAGVTLAWRAPKHDRRGKQLRSLEGYEVRRVDVTRRENESDESIDTTKDSAFAILGTIEDRSLAAREEQVAAARAAGKPTRRIEIPAELSSFSFVDTNVTPGNTYVYRVQPYNNGGVLSRDFDLIQVVYRGTTSQISQFTASNLDDVAADAFSFDQ